MYLPNFKITKNSLFNANKKRNSEDTVHQAAGRTMGHLAATTPLTLAAGETRVMVAMGVAKMTGTRSSRMTTIRFYRQEMIGQQ